MADAGRPAALLSVGEAARLLGLNRSTIHRALARGALAGTRQADGRWQIARPALAAWQAGRWLTRGTRRVTLAQVHGIRARYAAGGVTYRQLAAEYGVSHEAIRLIVAGRTWQQPV